VEIARRLDLIDPDAWAFTWVVDPPLFEPADEATAAGDVAVGHGAWTAVHHAFTAPKPGPETLLESEPGSVLADAYAGVWNGHEIGGGSIRIHRRDVQERVFAMMGIDHDEAQDKFGFLLDAFTFGAPPHGGIAFGWDRITALLAGSGGWAGAATAVATAQAARAAPLTVLDAAGAVGATHLVLLSSATAYGAWANNPVPLTEDAPLRPNPELEFAVRAAERDRPPARHR